MPTFSSAPASVAYDKSAKQPLGALNTGMGYDPTTASTVTKTTQYMGGAAETIGYNLPTPPAAPEPVTKSVKAASK